MKMWSVFSMVMRARLTGFLMSVSRLVAPARRVLPSITDASISMRLSIVKAEPNPALKAESSSIALTAASTASKAVPLTFSMLYPVWTAVLTPLSPAGLRSECQAPAPPCTTITGFCMAGFQCPIIYIGRGRFFEGDYLSSMWLCAFCRMRYVFTILT